MSDIKRTWRKALDLDELPDGRVKPVTCEHVTVCMTRFEGTSGRPRCTIRTSRSTPRCAVDWVFVSMTGRN